jgi:hypothetical protein
MALDDDEFKVAVVLGSPTSDVVQCARHCLKVLLALPNPDLENIFTAVALCLTDVLGNMNFPTQ